MTSWANPSFEQTQKDAKELVKMWQIDRLEQVKNPKTEFFLIVFFKLMNEVPKCEVCGAESENRCSRRMVKILLTVFFKKKYKNFVM